MPISIEAQEYNADKKNDDIQNNQKDIGDYLFKPNTKKSKKSYFSVVPALGYTLQTGFAGILSANLAMRQKDSSEKQSFFSTSVTYSQYQQTILPIYGNIWLNKNKLNVISDNRFIQYPSDIYGLGGRTDPNEGLTIDFSSIKLHESFSYLLAKNVYVGTGIYYDQYWNIKSIDSLKKSAVRRFATTVGSNEIAVGPILKFLYDNRINSINPENGVYLNILYRFNLKKMGSQSNWSSLLVDGRYYLKFPRHSKNVLSFWAMDWLTTNGTPPYLLKPSTGWDDQYNTGRGYIQGRFRGNNMQYLETEYRFQITGNGLIGGVVFVNVQKFSEEISNQFNTLIPGYGLGLRIKVNKHSRTNLCIDYGFGKDGSRGFFVNLGEVF